MRHWTVVCCRPAGDADGELLRADEHVAVDADCCGDARLLGTADVLYGSRPRSRCAAVRWLAETAARYPGCAVAAAVVDGGTWVAWCAARRELLEVAAAADALVGSWLHAWLVAGVTGHPDCHPEWAHPDGPGRPDPGCAGPVRRAP